MLVASELVRPPDRIVRRPQRGERVGAALVVVSGVILLWVVIDPGTRRIGPPTRERWATREATVGC